MIRKNTFTKQKQTHIHRKQTYGYQRGKGEGGINQEFGISKYKLPHNKKMNNKVLLYSTGSYVQYPIINYNGKEYIYMNHFAVYQKLTQHCKSTTIFKNL